MPTKGQLTILGSGTSQGVPVIGCDCKVCRSANPKDKRLRTAALIQWDELNIAIDCGPDFRQQMLREEVRTLDAVLITHEHNDHIIGLDDIRPFNFRAKQDMPVYATPKVITEIKKRFAYIFDQNPYPGAPRILLKEIYNNQVIMHRHLPITPVEVFHGRLPVLGFRLGSLAYLTDVKTISPEEMAKLQKLDTLIISALHHRPHHSHLNLEEALELIERLKPRQSYLIHISHRMGKYDEITPRLPAGVALSFDGLKVEFELEGKKPAPNY